jgi:hypothetical protein
MDAGLPRPAMDVKREVKLLHKKRALPMFRGGPSGCCESNYKRCGPFFYILYHQPISESEKLARECGSCLRTTVPVPSAPHSHEVALFSTSRGHDRERLLGTVIY